MLSFAAGAALLLFGSATPYIRGAPDGASGGTTAKLKMVKLAAPEVVLSRPNVQQIRLLAGIVLPQMPEQAVQLQEKQRPSITIGGTKVSFALAGGPETIEMTCGEKKQKLERNTTDPAVGFRAVTLRLEGDREYQLAFPYGYVYQQATTLSFQTGGRANAIQTSLVGMVCYRSGSVQQFEIDGQTVNIFDHNTDGFYTLGDDSVSIGPADGPANVFAPLGKYIATSKGVYEITSLAKDGSEITYKPFKGEATGVAFANGSAETKVTAVFCNSSDGLNLVAAPGDRPAVLNVLPGKYNLQYGMVYSPKTKKVIATVLPGNMAAVNAATDQSAIVTFGGPYTLEFEYQIADGKLAVSSSTFHLRGKLGEEYTNTTWAAEPQVSLAMAGGRTTDLGKMAFG